ncbi:MAG: type II secretion system F family protein [Nitrospinae bacterium]|nr:type II secretion system F family protein [Nitrospinota bacterium]
MPDFVYRAVNNEGQAVTGVMAAIDEPSLEVKLREIGFWLVDSSAKEAAGEKRGFSLLNRKAVKRRELIDFCLQTAALLDAGVNLMEALRALASDTHNPRFKRTIEDMARNIEAGYLLNEGMGRHPEVFDDQIVSMVQAGESGGALPQTFRELAAYLEWLENLMGEIKQATIYPVMVLVALTLFITVLFTFVVPKFITILEAMKVELPMPTRIVMLISDFFVNSWWVLLLFAFGTPIVIRLLKKKSAAFLYRWDRMKIDIPVFGELNRMFAISRFAQTFSTLFNAGIPVLQNLQLCQPVVGNKVYESVMVECEADMREGLMMSESFRRHDIFSPMMIRMLIVGEASGDLGGALSNVSRYYNQEIPRRVKKIFGIVEPTVMLVLIGIVGFTALAIFTPILSLMESL